MHSGRGHTRCSSLHVFNGFPTSDILYSRCVVSRHFGLRTGDGIVITLGTVTATSRQYHRLRLRRPLRFRTCRPYKTFTVATPGSSLQSLSTSPPHSPSLQLRITLRSTSAPTYSALAPVSFESQRRNRRRTTVGLLQLAPWYDLLLVILVVCLIFFTSVPLRIVALYRLLDHGRPSRRGGWTFHPLPRL